MSSFSEETKKKVWEKAKIDPNNDKNVYRKDKAGAWIHYNSYGNTKKETGVGWEIDHIKPTAKGGGDNIDNLQPLQWKNNREKGDDYPNYSTAISSKGTENIYKKQSF